jgi:hypothetical protein
MQNNPEALLNRQRTLTWLRTQKHSDAFQLYQLSEAFFRPLEELLGDKDYFLSDDGPSSLDCLALGYLAPMLFAPVTHRWLSDALQQRHPELKKYTQRLYRSTFEAETESWKHKLTSAPAPSAIDGAYFISNNLLGAFIPKSGNVINHDRSLTPVRTTPQSLISSYSVHIALLAVGAIAGVAVATTKLLQGPKGSNDILARDDRGRTTVRLSDMGEAGAAFTAAFDGIDPQVAREKERIGGATVVEVDVEVENGTVGRDVYVSR